MAKRERRKRKKASKSEAAAQVEKALVKRARDEAMANRESDALFVLDNGGASQKSRAELKQDLVLARKMKAEEKERRIEQAKKQAHKELIIQRRKAAKAGRALDKQLASPAVERQKRQAQAQAQAQGLFDLWGDSSAIADPTTKKTQKVLEEPKTDAKEKWVPLRRKGMHKGWRQERETNPREHRNNKFGVKAAVVVAPGGSYNPDEKQRRDLVQKRIAQELERRQILQGKDAETVVAEAQKQALALEDGRDASGASGSDDDDDDDVAHGPEAQDEANKEEDEEQDADDDDKEDWLVHTAEHHVAKGKLTKTQRNKQRRHRELMLEHERARRAKKVAHDLRRPKAITKNIRKEQEEAEAKRLAEKQRLDEFYADPTNAKIRIGGKVRPLLGSVPVLLEDEIAKARAGGGASMRTLPAKTNPMRDRMHTMLRQNKVELGDRNRKRRKGMKNKYDTRDNGGVNLLIAERQRQRTQGLIK